MHGTIDSMSVGEVEDKLIELRKSYPFKGSMKLLTMTHLKGHLSESLAMTYLLKKGNLVFKTIHDTGCVDLVAIDKRGKIHLYDVKTSLKYAKGKKKEKELTEC